MAIEKGISRNEPGQVDRVNLSPEDRADLSPLFRRAARFFAGMQVVRDNKPKVAEELLEVAQTGLYRVPPVNLKKAK